jgi:hypothetical protein
MGSLGGGLDGSLRMAHTPSMHSSTSWLFLPMFLCLTVFPLQVHAEAAHKILPRGARLTPPLEGNREIRNPLRELRSLRSQLLETSVNRRYAFGGKLELLLIDAPDIWNKQIQWLQKYRLLVDTLLDIPVKHYLADPGTRAALVRAIRWGKQTAIAMPWVHRLGYLRIQPILDGKVDSSEIVGIGVLNG